MKVWVSWAVEVPGAAVDGALVFAEGFVGFLVPVSVIVGAAADLFPGAAAVVARVFFVLLIVSISVDWSPSVDFLFSALFETASWYGFKETTDRACKLLASSVLAATSLIWLSIEFA